VKPARLFASTDCLGSQSPCRHVILSLNQTGHFSGDIPFFYFWDELLVQSRFFPGRPLWRQLTSPFQHPVPRPPSFPPDTQVSPFWDGFLRHVTFSAHLLPFARDELCGPNRFFDIVFCLLIWAQRMRHVGFLDPPDKFFFFYSG